MLEECLTGGADKLWSYRFPLVALSVNATPSSTHGFLPYFVLTGREMPIPSSLFMDIPKEGEMVPTSTIGTRLEFCQTNWGKVGEVEESTASPKTQIRHVL